jgi:cell division protein FtsI/penicillin-binding protein 2
VQKETKTSKMAKIKTELMFTRKQAMIAGSVLIIAIVVIAIASQADKKKEQAQQQAAENQEAEPEIYSRTAKIVSVGDNHV